MDTGSLHQLFPNLVGTFWWDPDPESAGAIIYDDNRVIPITDETHRIEFVPGVRALSSVKLLLKCADGRDRTLDGKPASPALHLRGGGYDGKSLGMDREPYHIEGEQWDVSQPADLGSECFGIAGISQFIADFQLDGEERTGILEASYCPDRERQYIPNW
jgi:hypothetical protein